MAQGINVAVVRQNVDCISFDIDWPIHGCAVLSLNLTGKEAVLRPPDINSFEVGNVNQFSFWCIFELYHTKVHDSETLPILRFRLSWLRRSRL